MKTIAQIDDWAAAVDNRAAVPEHEEHFLNWGRRAAAFRKKHPPETHSYGDSKRETFDLWMPEGPPKALFVFIHGGWWMHFDKGYFSNLAAGALAHGCAVGIPSYTLLPNCSLTELVAQARRAVTTIAGAVPEVPLTIGGHSAGGHLASMCALRGALPEEVAERVTRIVSISGIHDIRPLIGLPVNDTLGVTAEEGVALSPALHVPRPGLDVVAWAGGAETPVFRQQNAVLGAMWGGYATTWTGEAAGLNHFDVINPLEEAESEITRLVVGS